MLCYVHFQCLINQIKIRLWCFNEGNQNLSKQVKDMTYFKVPKKKGALPKGRGDAVGEREIQYYECDEHLPISEFSKYM